MGDEPCLGIDNMVIEVMDLVLVSKGFLIDPYGYLPLVLHGILWG